MLEFREAVYGMTSPLLPSRLKVDLDDGACASLAQNHVPGRIHQMPSDTGERNATEGLRRRFRDVVTSADELRAVVGYPQERAVAKVVRVIDDPARLFIAHSSFVFVGSAGADGTVDISPKGAPLAS